MSFDIVILCSDGPHHKYLLQKLAAHFEIAHVFMEPHQEQLLRLLKRRRWRDYAWARYHGFRRHILRLDVYRARQFLIGNHSTPPTTTVRWINDPEVLEFYRHKNPSMTIVIGTSILRKRLLDMITGPVINVHGGHLPYYRGNHCFFFAMYDGRFDKVGTTIHFVDAGLDTGDVIAVATPIITPKDSPEALYCKAGLLAADLLIDILTEFGESKSLPRFPQEPVGRTTRTRDRKPYHDIIFYFRRAIWWIFPHMHP
jgi:methionyl-tRNA formyltransferase